MFILSSYRITIYRPNLSVKGGVEMQDMEIDRPNQRSGKWAKSTGLDHNRATLRSFTGYVTWWFCDSNLEETDRHIDWGRQRAYASRIGQASSLLFSRSTVRGYSILYIIYYLINTHSGYCLLYCKMYWSVNFLFQHYISSLNSYLFVELAFRK